MHERRRQEDIFSPQKNFNGQTPSPNLQHNNNIIVDVQNKGRALSFKDKWMMNIKRQKYLIMGRERIIHVRQNSTNEKRGVLEKKVERYKDNSHLEICTFMCREIKYKNLFYFLFHQQEIFKWDFHLIKWEQVLLIK